MAPLLAELRPLGKLVPTLQGKLRLSEAVTSAQGLRQANCPPSDQERVEASPAPPFHFLPDLVVFINNNAKWARAVEAVMEHTSVSLLVNRMLSS